MNNKLKPASRLTLVFILAVVISGSILTYFSINNISNLKELTEKRIIEEQRELAVRISTGIQNNLKDATSGFENEIAPFDSLRKRLNETIQKYDFLSISFILDDKGGFLSPNFSVMKESQVKSKSSNRYNLSFQEAEKAEFVGQNLSLAQSKYASCLRDSKSKVDSVKAFNALGRVAVKLKKNEDAIEYYETIAGQYYTTSSPDGFPYVYYVISQLLKNFNDSANVKPIVVDCLQKMTSGEICLNFYTDELLTEIEEWRNEKLGDDTDYFQRINKLIENINRQLHFVAKYKNDVSYAFNGEAINYRLGTKNRFEVLTSFAANSSELLIVNRDFQYHFGFLVDGAKLFDNVLTELLQSGFEFNYMVSLTDGYERTPNNGQLIYLAPVNPLFSKRYIQIRLRNENLIAELVNRRSWIYGIASVLLIVAMFLGVLLILRDISREKHIARLRADFISNVTHELKTPLTSIYMFAESLLLNRVKSANEKQEYLSIIIKESERLKRMINNILEISKIEKGKSDYSFKSSNLADSLHASIQELDYWLEKENFNVFTEIDENINAAIDSEKMKQAFSNLINNAIKYSGDSKDIFIRLHENSKGIIIEIEDKGIGISEDFLPRIFEKFYRIEQNTNVSGTGLGLTVVKEIVEAHKGTITVSSKPGKGSKFSITLNRKQ